MGVAMVDGQNMPTTMLRVMEVLPPILNILTLLAMESLARARQVQSTTMLLQFGALPLLKEKVTWPLMSKILALFRFALMQVIGILTQVESCPLVERVLTTVFRQW